jgi:hypothetical protein
MLLHQVQNTGLFLWQQRGEATARSDGTWASTFPYQQQRKLEKTKKLRKSTKTGTGMQ